MLEFVGLVRLCWVEGGLEGECRHGDLVRLAWFAIDESVGHELKVT